MDSNDRLDELDPEQHDLNKILARLNEFVALPEDEQEALLALAGEDVTHELSWSGLYEASHLLTGFLSEGRDTRVAVRDRDGSLKLVVEGAGAAWGPIPLCQSHLDGTWTDSTDDADLVDSLGAYLREELGSPASAELVLAVIRDLPE